MRRSSVKRKTKETDVEVEVNLDGGDVNIDVPSGFFAHMLDSLSRHSGIGLKVVARGDTDVDLHHTVEDIGIVMGLAIKEALGDKAGINRFGLAKIPMDESLVEACMDISDRAYFTIHGEDPFHNQAGNFPLELVPEFFRALAFNAGITLHVTVYAARNTHHAAEACFKALARALAQAVAISGKDIPSTKGVL
ncbi:MAG TPA: imidazoleglycerol-phosphate dehydratase HisB [Deltaproteobacteria bacterium]|nr:imidazoleglycerol-phosphate dehydratase HisB [Deltaproteobacteria bacterium]RLB01255.1 MAG: imidazoleglycerol-phosphate dehydratase HisB [Deltaproteobacteria bacterium]HDM32509.1 imidazoleglycerol-phosphate dehydratase HisB [Deltaproteobacteria bacterium]